VSSPDEPWMCKHLGSRRNYDGEALLRTFVDLPKKYVQLIFFLLLRDMTTEMK
jgi:hypothetical protein